MILALPLASCGGSTPSSDDIRLTGPDQSVMAPCTRPVAIPETATTQGQQAALWRRDRLNLVACVEKHDLTVTWIEMTLKSFERE
jgi:hypothetical protein